MLLTNHTLTGVALGLIIDQPAVLLPAAVASHLAMDALPHFGFREELNKSSFRNPRFLLLGSADFALSLVVTAAACLAFPARAGHILLGVFGADLPDLTYIPVIIFGRGRVERWLPFYRPMLRFLARIQWFERPIGLITEGIWATLMLIIINVVR